MKIEYDPAKNERNIRERGLSFERMADFDWESSLPEEDTRFAYPERRFVVLGFVDGRYTSSASRPSPAAFGLSVFVKRMIGSSVTMSKKPLTGKDGEVRELTREDMRRMRPIAEVLPAELLAVLPKRKRGERGPQKTPTKEQVTLRLDSDVLASFRERGPGWQTQINETLKRSIAKAK